jgi:hypothetical protein
MSVTERRAAMQPYLDQGLSRSEAYQRFLTSPVAHQPIESQRQQQRNVETRDLTPLERTLRRAAAGSAITTPIAPKLIAKPAAKVAKRKVPKATEEPWLADTKPSARLSTLIRSARQARTRTR